MYDVKTLRDECALHLHDVDFAEISEAHWLSFIRSASMDGRNAGWYIDVEDDESLTVAASDYDYTVPQHFAYLDRILIEETINGTSVYVREVPRSHWTVRLNGGVPVIEFSTVTELTVDKKLKLIGQKRPTLYTSADQPVDSGMESFLRERALYFAFRYTGAGLSELARWRQQMSVQSHQSSEAFLMRHPQEFRMHPSAILVPGRG